MKMTTSGTTTEIGDGIECNGSGAVHTNREGGGSTLVDEGSSERRGPGEASAVLHDLRHASAAEILKSANLFGEPGPGWELIYEFMLTWSAHQTEERSGS